MSGYGSNGDPRHSRSSEAERSMNVNSIDLKTAVISGGFEGLSKEDIDKFYSQNLNDITQTAKPKKGSFQITSVTSGSHNSDLKDDPGEDSQDDLDDTHTYTEDNMSMEWSNKTTDLDPEKSPILEQEEPPAPEDTLTLHRPQPTKNSADFAPVTKERSSTDNQLSRFRVVKIVTQEPFKRGRWTCYDFMPDSNKQHPDIQGLDLRSDNKDHVVVTGSETSSAASSIHYVHGQDDPAKNPLNTQPLTQTLTSPIYFDVDQQKQMHLHQQSQSNVLNGHHDPNINPYLVPDQYDPSNTNSNLGGVQGAPMSGQPSITHIPQAQPGAITPDAAFSQPGTSGQPLPAANTVQTMNGNGVHGQPTLPYQTGQPPIHQASITSNPTSLLANQSTIHSNPPQHIISQSQVDPNMPASMGHSALSNTYPQAGLLQTAPGNGAGQYGQSQHVSADVTHTMLRISSSHQTARSDFKPHSPRTHRISIGGEELELSDDMGREGTSALLEKIAGIPAALGSPTKDTDGEDSGPNSVAIDNKIEQAMDLVKSHLMFAVREEVEVLKEQIKELEDHKMALEFENSFLRNAASAETLSKLAAATQSQPPPSSNT